MKATLEIPEKEIKSSASSLEELTVFIDDVKVTFLRYPFPLLEDFVFYKDVPLLTVKEIAASKAYTIGRRGSYKDYIDLYFVIKNNYTSISGIIKLAEKKYKKEFNSRLFLEQLVYFKDIEDTDILFLQESVGREELERFFLKKVKKLKI